jgi:putative ABC transport system substrate-binding protein
MRIKRRDFITLLGGAAAGWPFAARAQQGERMRRLGWLWPFDENDPGGKLWMAAFIQGLADLGWTEGRNLQIDIRWNPKTPEEARKFTQELIALHPDVLVTGVPSLVRAVQQETQTIPIVFHGAGDPLVAGIVTSIPHPGGNTTGVTDRLSRINWLYMSPRHGDIWLSRENDQQRRHTKSIFARDGSLQILSQG